MWQQALFIFIATFVASFLGSMVGLSLGAAIMVRTLQDHDLKKQNESK